MGQLISGMMGPVFGWRSPFLVISAPCLLCGLLVMFTCVEPVRGGQEEEVLVMRRAREKFVISSPPSRTNLSLSAFNEDMDNGSTGPTPLSSAGRMKGSVSSRGHGRSRDRGGGGMWEEEDDNEEEKKGSSAYVFNQNYRGQGLGLGPGLALGQGLGLGLGIGGSEPPLPSSSSSSSSGIHRSTGPPSIHPCYGATNILHDAAAPATPATTLAAPGARTTGTTLTTGTRTTTSGTGTGAATNDRGGGVMNANGLIGTMGGGGRGCGSGMTTTSTSYTRTFTSGSDDGSK